MKIIKDNTKSNEKEIICPDCTSVFLLEFSDPERTLRYVKNFFGEYYYSYNCPCCGHEFKSEKNPFPYNYSGW